MPSNTTNQGSDPALQTAGGASERPTLLQRAEVHADFVDSVMGDGVNPFSVVIDNVTSPVDAIVNGRKTVLFGTNSYLGLNFHPDCIEAAISAIRAHGTGSTASRVAGGNSREHVALEADIASFYGRKHAVVYSTGFMANLGVITALARRGDVVFFDAHCHASIIDACRLSGARMRPFRHNDADHLAQLMDKTRTARGHRMVIAEGVYSVWGDVADLKNVLSVAKSHGAVTVVDEAHSFGIFGEHGRGVAEALGVETDADIITGTFSKSAGVIGGYSVTNLDQLSTLRLIARTYLFTASLPPSAIASARAAIRVMSADKTLRKRVWTNAEMMLSGLERAGLPVTPTSSTIGSIPLPDMQSGLAFWKELLARGLYVNLLFPPATTDNMPVLRFSVSASHTPDHIDNAIKILSDVWHLSSGESATLPLVERPVVLRELGA